MKKNVIITGGSRGLGEALVINFIKNNWNVAAISRDEDKLKNLYSNLLPYGKIEYRSIDVRNENLINQFVNDIVKKWKYIDLLINNAGIGYFKPFIEINLNEIREVFDINYLGMINCIKAVLPFMIQNHSGTIINISSSCGLSGNKNESIYGPIKFAVNGLTEVLSKELKDYGITVSAICPSAIDTGFSSNRNAELPESKKIKKDEIAQLIYESVNKASAIYGINSPKPTNKIQRLFGKINKAEISIVKKL